MPMVLVKFWEEAREFTEEQIEELRAARLLREDPPIPTPTPPPPVPAAGGQPDTEEQPS
jgi:hypothetical protein